MDGLVFVPVILLIESAQALYGRPVCDRFALASGTNNVWLKFRQPWLERSAAPAMGDGHEFHTSYYLLQPRPGTLEDGISGDILIHFLITLGFCLL